jgi:hypothetical protein
MKIKLIFNNIIPFKGYLAMCVFPFIFVRKDARNLTVKDINHEKIHGMQQIETHIVALILAVLLAAVGLFSWWWVLVSPLVYFALYGLEYIVRWICYGFDTREAYRNISFEQEAYLNESDLTYIKNRHLFASWKYLFRKTYHRK